MKNRSDLIDNYKVMLIFLVVLGHLMEWYSVASLPGVFRAIIYSFHMPAFVFLSGFFSKNVEKNMEIAWERCILPYLVFNTIWIFLVQVLEHSMKIWQINVFVANYAFWYLLSLFFWRVLTPYFARLRFALLILAAFALYVGCFPEFNRFLSASRTIVYFPFFLLGYYTTEKHIQKIRRIPRIWGWFMLLVCFGITALCNIYGIFPVKSYENMLCYHDIGVNNLQGIIMRLIQMIIAVVLLLAWLNVLPDKKLRITGIGKETVTIYLLSCFILYGIRKLTDELHMTSVLAANGVRLVLLSILVSLVVVYVCSRKKICAGYRKFFGCLGAVFFKKNEKMS